MEKACSGLPWRDLLGPKQLTDIYLTERSIADVSDNQVWARGGALVYPKRSGKAISIPGLQNAPLKEKVTEDLVDIMMGWRHSGFNVYCGPRIQPGEEEEAIENLARYIIRASFSQERMTYIPEESKVVYQSKYGKEAQVRGPTW